MYLVIIYLIADIDFYHHIYYHRGRIQDVATCIHKKNVKAARLYSTRLYLTLDIYEQH